MGLIRPRSVAAALAVTAAVLFGMQGTALADGWVTWTNDATGWGLQSDGLVDQAVSDGYSLYTQSGFICADQGCSAHARSIDWYDYRQPDGSWVEASGYDIARFGQDGCLDGNDQFGSYGAAYTHTCIAGNNDPDPWQHWYEYRDANGRWYLQNVHTGLFLDGGNGPNGNGQFSNVHVYVNGNYGNGDLYQRWS